MSTPSRPPPKRVLSDIPEPKQKSGVGGAVFNLVNCILGSGIIGLPFAVKEAGLVGGVLLLCIVSYLATKSLRIIVDTAAFHPKLKMVGVKTYEDLMMMPFGHGGSLFILINKFLFVYGTMVAYLLIIKDTVPVILGVSDNGAARQIVMVVTSLVIILPLSMLRDVASLSWTSLISVLAETCLVVFIILYSPVADSINEEGGFGNVIKNSAFNDRFFIGLGIISQAMSCHPLALISFGSLQNKTSASWASVASLSVGIALVLCAIMGVFGYLGFMEDTEGDILNNFEKGSLAANGSRGLVAITMVFTYPIQNFVTRHVIAKILFNGDSEGEVDGPDGEKVPAQKFLGFIGRREKITLSVYVGALIPALIFNDLGPVLSITGAVGGSCLAFIGPGLIYIGAYGEDFMQYTDAMMGKKTADAEATPELPVEGDAAAVMYESSGGSAPLWWYPTLMPIWRAIASTGAMGMKIRLEQLEEEHPGVTSVEASGEIIGPTHGMYFLSMFMIVFGIVALVAGLISNIVVNM